MLQGKHAHALLESVTFGRFFSESLSYDNRWSYLPSHKKYVEEAARYAQPGSVAKKKAFFESHYKAIAARKAATAILEKTAVGDDDDAASDALQRVIFSSPFGVQMVKIKDAEKDEHGKEEDAAISGNETPVENSFNDYSSLENQNKFSDMEIKQDPIAEEDSSLSSLSSLNSSMQQKTCKLPSRSVHPVNAHFKGKDVIRSTRKPTGESMDRERSSSKPICKLTKVTSVKQTEKRSSSAAKGSRTPLRNPSAATTGVPSPRPEIKSLKTPPIQPFTSKSRTNGPKWNILSALKSLKACRNKLQSANLSSPFNLRTEERATKRKQKNEMQKEQTQEAVKVLHSIKNNQSRKLTCSSFCFKARPFPDFYKDGQRQTASNQMKRTPPQQRPPIAGRSIVNKKQGIVSMPQSSSQCKTDKPRINSIPYTTRS